MSYQLARRVIYGLKQQFPCSIDLYCPGATTLDLTTGAMTTPATKVKVRKAVVLPTKGIREGHYNRAYVRWSVGFTYGGYTDSDTETFIVDRADIKGFNLTLNCWIVRDHKRYEIKEIAEHAIARCVAMTAVRLEGAPVNEIIEVKVSDTVTFTEGETTVVV